MANKYTGRDWKQIKEPQPMLKWTSQDRKVAETVAKNHGLTVDELLAIIHHESAGTMAPDVVNSIGATGLIQLMPTTSAEYLLKAARKEAESKGITGKDLNKNFPFFWQVPKEKQKQVALDAQKAVAGMGISEQLLLTDTYLSDRAQGKKGYDNVYTAVFAGNPNQKEFKKGEAAYANNKAHDKNKDGVLTRDEWMAPAKEKVALFSGGDYVSQGKTMAKGQPEDEESFIEVDFDDPTSTRAGVRKAIKEHRQTVDAERVRGDSDRFMSTVSNLLQLSFPTRRDEAKKASQGNIHLMRGGSEDAKNFEARWPDRVGANFKTPQGNVRVLRREFEGKPLPFGFLAGVGAHEAGHDFITEHEPPPSIMQEDTPMPSEGEDTFESALRQALESGGKALDEEHLAQNADPFDGIRKVLGYPTAADTLPSKAHKLDNMLEANPPAERYEWQSSAWEDDK